MGKILGLFFVLMSLSFVTKADGLVVYELDQQPVFVDSSQQKKLTYQDVGKNSPQHAQHKKLSKLERWRQAFKKIQVAKRENRRAKTHTERV